MMLAMSNRPTLCVHSKPFKRFVDSLGMSTRELGKVYSDRFTPGKDSSATVNRLLQQDLIPVDAADRLTLMLDLHPLLIWDQKEWDEPIEVSGGLRKRSQEVA